MNPMKTTRLEISETAVTVVASEDRFHAIARDAIVDARRRIQEQVSADPFFLSTLEPYGADDCINHIARRMCEASERAGVGPMATVAGTVAQVALEAMVEGGCRHGWVDNGGDISIILEGPAVVEVFSDPDGGESLAMELGPTEGIIGICSSSGRLGHSVSMGNADIAVACASSAILADALATAIGNRVVDVASLDGCFDDFVGIDGFAAGLAVCEGAASIYGSLPPLVRAEHCTDRMTVHSSMPANAYAGACNGRSSSTTGVRP